MTAATDTHIKSPMTGEWWIWRADGKPVDGDVLILCNGGSGEIPSWPPWCDESIDLFNEERVSYVAERFLRASPSTWPNRYHREVLYFEHNTTDEETNKQEQPK